MEFRELMPVYQKACKIFESDLDWQTKYDLIFSADISRKVIFEYYDPDMDYEDDVRAFMNGFDDYYKKQSKINDIIYK